MIHVSNVGVLEIAVDRDRSISVERKVQFGEGDISGVREAPLLPEREYTPIYRVSTLSNDMQYLMVRSSLTFK